MKKNGHMPAASCSSRISLGMVMIVFLGLFCVAGLYGPGQADAAVAALDAWTEVYSANPAATSGTATSGNFTVSGTGSNKLLVVGMCWEFGTTGTMQINGGTLNVRLDNSSGAQFTTIGLTSVAGAEHCYAGYLPESQFTSGTHAIYVSWAATTTTTNCSALSIMAGTYQGVDQTTTINSTAANNANTATITLGTNVSYTANSVTVFVTANGGTALTTVTKTAPNFTQQLVGATTLHSPFIADASNASAGSYPSTDTITFSGATARNRAAVVAGALNPAPAGSPGSIQLSASTYSVAENGGTVTITVTRTGGSSGAVGISYATSNGTATAGSDYTSASGNLSWADGDTANKTFVVSITDDGTVEGNETFTASLSGPTGGATLGSPASATVTITDNDGAPAAVPAGSWPLFGLVMSGIIVYGLLWHRRQGQPSS